MKPDWKPFDTAPKDGSIFLAYPCGFNEEIARVYLRRWQQYDWVKVDHDTKKFVPVREQSEWCFSGSTKMVPTPYMLYWAPLCDIFPE